MMKMGIYNQLYQIRFHIIVSQNSFENMNKRIIFCFFSTAS